MTPEEKRRKFEEDLVEIAVAEYYAYVAQNKKPRSEKEAKVFYDAMRLGVIRGINFATNQYMQSIEKFKKEKEHADGTTKSDKQV